MISGLEVKVLDINSDYYGVPAINLMENAGKNITKFINDNLKTKKKEILIFCGLGNNGGDGFVATRHLSKKYDVTLFLIGKKEDIKTGIAKKNFNKLKNTKTKILDIGSKDDISDLISNNRVIVDAMLGIGIKGELREPYKTIVDMINCSKNKTIISVDIPTGFGSKKSIKPDFTVTFHDIKYGMNQKNCGEISIVDIAIPKKAVDYVGPGELKTFYPIPKKDSHKGENGRLLVVGGGPYYGAPALSSFAAQRSGTDLIYLATPKKVAKAVTSYSPLVIKPVRLAKHLAKLSPTLIVKELKDSDNLIVEDFEIIKEYIDKVNTLLVGPGLGSDKKTQKAVEKIIRLFVKSKKSIVIDADAIKVIGRNLDIVKNSNIVLTPHTGEFKELTGIGLSKKLGDRKKNVEKWAKKLNVTICLKGPVDIVSNGEQTKLNDIHNEAMTVGGTGDVLAGVIAGLMSKNVEGFDAARMGVFINGAAGNYAFKKRSYGLVATDIIDEIPSVIKKYL